MVELELTFMSNENTKQQDDTDSLISGINDAFNFDSIGVYNENENPFIEPSKVMSFEPDEPTDDDDEEDDIDTVDEEDEDADTYSKALNIFNMNKEQPTDDTTKHEEPQVVVKRGRGRPRKIVVDGATTPKAVKPKVLRNITTLPDFAKKLRSVEHDNNEYSFNEFDKLEVTYKRILDPSGEPTNYYSTHTRTPGGDTYNTSNTLLSHNYVVIHMDDLISKIQTEMSIDEIDMKVSPFVIEWIAQTEKTLKTIESQVQKDLFYIVSGFKSDEVFKSNKTVIEMCISNSYDGKNSFHISFNFHFKNDDKSIRDFFTINQFAGKYFHKGLQIADVKDSIHKIEEEKIVKSIHAMKDYHLSEGDIKRIKSKMCKENRNKFDDILEEFPESYNNLYYNLLCLSGILNDNYTAAEHSGLTQITGKIIAKAVLLYNTKQLKLA